MKGLDIITDPSAKHSRSDRDLVASLFFMGLGYALLSFCLYRILCFISVSAPFFVLYIGIGFPLGACLVALCLRSLQTGFKLATFMLPVTSIGILIAGAGASHFWGKLAPDLFVSFNLTTFLVIIFVFSAVSLPFFIIWGAAEYISFKLILTNHRFRSIFYVVTICALLCAFIVGNLSIPHLGLLRTVAIVPFFSLLSFFFATSRINLWKFLFPGVCCLIVWWIAGQYETSYTKMFYYDNFVQTIHQAENMTNTSTDDDFSPTLLKSFWGKYCHLAFICWQSTGVSKAKENITCCYDGLPIWRTTPSLSSGFFDNIIFDNIRKNADVCVIGAGGGNQVAHAIAAEAQKIVAVDLIPEIFHELKNDLSWVNGNIYNLPRVKTIAADGLQYIQDSGKKFDYIVLPSAESFAFILKSFFEPGQHIHTLESFRVFRNHLKPDGELIIFKDVDKNGKLFNSFAKTLKAAELNVSGFLISSKPFDHFLLVASRKSLPQKYSDRVLARLRRFNAQYVDFQKTPPSGEILTDNSPWGRGVLGTMFPVENLKVPYIILIGLLATGVGGIAWLLPICRASRQTREPLYHRQLYAFAGLFIGVNAIYLENGIIFWFIMNLANPLAAFFIGSSVFLLLWGCSNMKVNAWGGLTALAVMGIAGMFIFSEWHGYAGFASILLILAGSGFCFSFLTLRFESQLLNLFLLDGLGSVVGGLLGIGIPLFFGFRVYFDLLPWLALATLMLTILAGLSARKVIHNRMPASLNEKDRVAFH
ncbi:MAG: hypothetical protein SWH68_04275 [Thermodesulfobacteriota bacterium]|nr:hypothetical protein [Thermodesulfobacteriota bacterium]